jgi:hypothetical protein
MYKMSYVAWVNIIIFIAVWNVDGKDQDVRVVGKGGRKRCQEPFLEVFHSRREATKRFLTRS